jgi:hypothetical protein
MSENEKDEGLTTSDDTQRRDKYTETRSSKKPKVTVERTVQRQREGKINR